MRCRELLETHPEVLQDRHGLRFAPGAPPSAIATALQRSGVVMLRQALPPDLLPACRYAFHQFSRSLGKPRRRIWGDDGADSRWADGESDSGSFHMPWVVRHRGRRPAAAVISALVASWVWPVIEALCGSREIAIPLGHCVARHSIDVDLYAGAHQDATAVSPLLPFSIWVPFGDVVPGHDSGLGFIAPPPPAALPALPNGEIGAAYLKESVPKIWLPTYRAGDVTIHTNLSPHFTTGFGTGADRYSIEVRAAARTKVPTGEMNPGVFVDQATIVGTQRPPKGRTGDFLATLHTQA